ncbi:MAG: hypothetical protein HY698_21390 [Deltaproteobacteria bacterium]|nr:hypothetical protein [Deltaproteobacteria bacterium]
MIIGVDPGGLFGGDDATMLSRFAEQTGITFPIGWDTDGTYRDFRVGAGIAPFPLDVVVGPDGRIAYLSREYEPTELKAVVESLVSP